MERPWWQKIIYQIWPKFYRFLNEAISFILLILKSAVKLAMEQIRQNI
jgi:hypothetical protein